MLKAFSATRKRAPLPRFLTDSRAERLTFEKCIYEAYLAFRGVGGKKPDEGRGRWAEANLDPAVDSLSLSHLANRFHDGNISRAHFWHNFIDEAAADLEGDEQWINEASCPQGRKKALEELQSRKELSRDYGRFLHLCYEFQDMLRRHQVRCVTYMEVFSPEDPGTTFGYCDPRVLDALFQTVTISAEDFEIVYAAMRSDVDLFVTDDKRLLSCILSLGLNLPLSPEDFCTASSYENLVATWRCQAGTAADN